AVGYGKKLKPHIGAIILGGRLRST
ncbi:MAG: hypothetical protein RLZZ292_3687, partial [Bacteroidota bacterium]